MSGFKLSVFSGIRPKIGARLLREAEAQIADNGKLFSGELRSWKRPADVAVPTKAALGVVRSIFRINFEDTDYWLNWLTDVDCVRGPVAGDEIQRIYFTGDGEPRMSFAELATQSGIDFPVAAHVLGVFPPSTAPTVTPSGGVGAVETRAYVYTFVTALGEESQPSPATVANGKVDDTWAISNMDVAPANTFTVTGASWAAGVATLTVASTRGLRIGEEVSVAGVNPSGYNTTKAVLTDVQAGSIKYAVAANPGAYVSGGTISRIATHNTAGMKKRIYRVLSGTAGAEFQFVAEIAVATTTYNDTVAGTALGEILQSEDWAMPPTDMKGIGGTEKGVMYGFAKNELCLSEPFRPHAWPVRYRIAFTNEIVAVKGYSNGIVVAKKGPPAVVVGSTPDSMTAEDAERNEPCLSKRGAVGMGFGVIYPSPNGWVLSGVGGTTVASEDVLTEEEFAKFFPSSMVAAEHQGRYFAWFTDAGVSRGVIFDRGGQGPVLVPLQQSADAAWSDRETGKLYIVHDGTIKLWDGDALNNLPFDWKSRIITLSADANMGAARVRAKYSEFVGAAAAEQEQLALDAEYNADILDNPEVWPGQSNTRGDFGGSMLGEFMLGGSLLRDASFSSFDERSLQFQLFAANDDGEMELRHTENLTDERPFRLPGEYMASEYEVRLLGNVDVRCVEVAETMRGLKEL